MDQAKVCGHFVLLCLVFVAAARSDITVERREASGKDNHLADVFSNPSCTSASCGAVSGASGCAVTDCCTCQCLYDKATYLANSKKCEDNTIVHQECNFKFAKTDNNPLTVVDMTKKKDHVKFESKPSTGCNTDITVAGWSWQDITGQWKKGNSSNFEIKTSDGGKKLSQLKWDWNQAMDAKYFGLIVRIHLKCGSQDLGCVMMKTAGEFTYNETVPDQNVHTTVSVSIGDITTPLLKTTEIPVKPSINEITNQVSRENNDGTDGPSPTKAQPSAVPANEENGGQSDGAGNTDTQKDSTKDDKQATSSQSAVVIGVGVVAGLFGSLLLICSLYFVAKKYRKKRMVEKGNDKAVPVEEVRVEEDPLYSKLEVVKLQAENFDNPTYEVNGNEKLMINRDLKKRPPSLPLPPIPGQQGVRPESVYEGLIKTPDQTTSASPSDQKERDVPNSDADYENPPQQNVITSHPPEYDNPSAPVHLGRQKPSNHSPEAETENYLFPCDSNDSITDSAEYKVLEPPYQAPKPAGEGISEPDYLVLEDTQA